ncbi:MAG: hypothetical protein RL385_2733 [Pseudomonadota bacterium]|jgi:hypothetical protein
MTQLTDPVRWTADPAEAPEGLRDMFEAGRNEGPSGSQMRSLSLKLAAAAAGVGVAATAGKPIAASLGGTTVKTAFAGAKLFAAVTVAGAMTLGGAALYRSATPSPTFKSGAEAGAAASQLPDLGRQHEVTGAGLPEKMSPSISPLAPQVPVAESPAASPSAGAEVAGKQAVPRQEGDRLQVNPARGRDRLRSSRSASLGFQDSGNTPVGASSSMAQPEARGSETPTALSPAAQGAKPVSGVADNAAQAAPTELGLLRQAQASLNSRPREAFALTQKHRASFPRGQFAEERDALAIQALMRAGERNAALDLAAHFVNAYPKSAHAHQFRELLNAR